MPFYGDKTIEAIWQSAKPVEGYNPNMNTHNSKQVSRLTETVM